MTPAQSNEAIESLEAIRRHQDEVVRAVAIPWWYWAVVAVLVVAVGGAVDSHRPAVVGLAVTALIVIVGGLSVRLIFGGSRRPQIHHDLLGQRGALAIDGLVACVVVSSLALGFALQALGFPLAATMATLAAAIELVTLGPLLMRRLTREMRAHEVGPRS